MVKKFKLYVWIDVNCDYTCGGSVAIAETKEEALLLIGEVEWPGQAERWVHEHPEYTDDRLTVYSLNEKHAFVFWGGS